MELTTFAIYLPQERFFSYANLEIFVTWNVQFNVNGISFITVVCMSIKELMNYLVFHLLLPLLRLHILVTFVY